MEPILTSIDEAVVVLLERLRAIASAAEVDGGDSLGDAFAVVVQGNVAERSNGGGEELLIKQLIVSGEDVGRVNRYVPLFEPR